MTIPSEPVSFRLPPALLTKLDEEAARRGLKRGELVRQLVTDALDGSRGVRLEARLEAVEAAVLDIAAEVRQTLAATTAAILIDLNQPPDKRAWLSSDEINAWVRKNVLG